MCFFKSPKMPDVPQAPVVTPAPLPAAPIEKKETAPLPPPVPTASAPAPQQIEAQRRRKQQAVRYGIMSTIKTSPLGVTGAGTDFGTGAGKTTLGS